MIDTDDGFVALLTRRAQVDPSGLFARYEGAPVTFGELDRMATSLAVWMRSIGLCANRYAYTAAKTGSSR